MTAKKRARKTPAKAPATRTPKHGGGKLRTGNPGNKGGPGRPPDAWKELCRDLASRPAMIKSAEKVLKNPKHPAWLGAWKFLAEQGYGRAVAQVDVTSGGKAIEKQVVVIGGQRIEF